MIKTNTTKVKRIFYCFAPPFFITKKSIPVTYLIEGRTNKTMDLALYAPVGSIINRRINESDK